MIHIQKAGELRRDTKSLCGIPLESLGRQNGHVEFRNRKHADCRLCLDVAERTERMQHKAPSF